VPGLTTALQGFVAIWGRSAMRDYGQTYI